MSQLVARAVKSARADRISNRAAELGFYFLFALFPALICTSAMAGLVVRSADAIYARLLAYLALVIPASAMGAVMETFKQTTTASSPGKITLGLLTAIWSASVGFSAIQDTLNEVYKIEERRSYLAARLSAIRVTLLLTAIVSLALASMFGGDWVAGNIRHHIGRGIVWQMVAEAARASAWALAAALLLLAFAVVYYWAPDWRHHRWRLFTPGAFVGVFGWLIASIGFRVYLHFFDSFPITYGSLGAVMILLMWFYMSGLMLLFGAEINSEIEAAAVERHISKRRVDSLRNIEAA